MKLLIGTTNKTKINGAFEAFKEYYNDLSIEGISVSSEVNDQPLNEEIYLGAINRVNNLIEYSEIHNLEANYYLAIESGIMNLYGKWVIINIAIIKDKNGYESIGTSSGFPVPKKYVKDIINTDLGKVIDIIYKDNNERIKKGTINILTKDKINRLDLTKEAFIMALTQFINKDWKD